jgi:hypothetical protein
MTAIAWQGEAMLLQWAESSTRGRTITLLLPEEDETHPFRDYSFKSGKRSGQRFMCVFVALGDDEQPEPEPLSKEAVMLCKNPAFWEWASSSVWTTIDSEESAKDFLCQQLSITSRSELNTDEQAAARFRLLAAQFRQTQRIL